ncbi:bifunctional oligoribonuclease/PAP phosphatase NrnA [Proteiniclasticum sp. C24MP]|uniref:DHH family phosphoesterase n=1 Tax=Proteiniclasticum sp. C24MP TaxID=3374101 RepID=UPI003754479C
MMFKEIAEKIMGTERIAVVTHASPDGDAVGSTMGIVLALRELGKDVEILSKEPGPENLSFLPLYEEYGVQATLSGDRELLLALDCGNKDRLSMERDGFDEIFKINIDHHVSNEMYGSLNYVDTASASTAEIIFELIEALRISPDQSMAQCLYTGIVSDTGSFRFPSTTAKTLRITAELIETGLDFSEIQRVLFSTSEFKRIKLLGRALMTLESYMEGFVSVMNLEANDFNILSISDRDSGDIVNYGLEPPEADVSVLLKEAEGFFRVSVRTKLEIDASSLCGKFDGGGHVRAAGCNIKAESLEEAKRLILEEIERMRAV